MTHVEHVRRLASSRKVDMERVGLDLNGPRATVRRLLGIVDRQWQGVHRKVHQAVPADVLFERTAWRTASRPGRPSPDRLRPPAEIERFDESLRRELPDMVGGVRRPGHRAGRGRRMGARLQPQSATPVAEDCHVGVGVPALHGGRPKAAVPEPVGGGRAAAEGPRRNDPPDRDHGRPVSRSPPT